MGADRGLSEGHRVQPFLAAARFLAERDGPAPDEEQRAITDRAAQLGLNWWVYAVAANDRLHASPADVRRWPFAESYEAHLFVDAMARMDRLMASRRP
ncbi:hypothetical protein K0U83_01020 [bacterium]|nr:hypothetical protein [bacterium]